MWLYLTAVLRFSFLHKKSAGSGSFIMLMPLLKTNSSNFWHLITFNCTRNHKSSHWHRQPTFVCTDWNGPIGHGVQEKWLTLCSKWTEPTVRINKTITRIFLLLIQSCQAMIDSIYMNAFMLPLWNQKWLMWKRRIQEIHLGFLL